MITNESYELNGATERSFVCRMVLDPLILPQVALHLNARGFQDEIARLSVTVLLAYWKKYNRAPTPVAFLQEVREKVNDGKVTREQLAEVGVLLEDGRANPVDSDYVIKTLLAKQRIAAFWSMSFGMTDLLATGKYDEIVRDVLRVDAIGKPGTSERGQFVGPSIAERTKQRQAQQLRHWGSGVPDLDNLTSGGLSLDNPLGVLVAGPKQGKSMFLHWVGLAAVAEGATVFHASMENGANECMNRYDSAISGVLLNELKTNSVLVHDRVQAWDLWARGNGGGTLHVHEFPQGSTTPRDIDSYIDRMQAEDPWWKPTVILVDYPGEMQCDERSRTEKRHEELAEIYRQVRALLRKRQAVGWTVDQLKADALEKSKPSLTDISGAFAKIQLVDLAVAMVRTPDDQATGYARLFTLASRFSAMGTETPRFRMDLSRARFLDAVPRGCLPA